MSECITLCECSVNLVRVYDGRRARPRGVNVDVAAKIYKNV